MELKVCKFGGTSLATRAQVEKCIQIMLADRRRKCMVVSAPGSRFKGDTKITDLLIRAAEEFPRSGKTAAADEILHRFQEIIPEDPALLQALATELQKRLSAAPGAHYVESLKAFGEYACARVVAGILQQKNIRADFCDTAELGLLVNTRGFFIEPDPACYPKMARALKLHSGCDILVIPGFYGVDKTGAIQTLPRGGSDITGAVMARVLNAVVYENWTDEDGLRRADPRIVPQAGTIPEMTFDEARELAYMGFKLQDACFAPIKGRNIILNVRNTNNPVHPGTRIMDCRQVDPEERIVGVACETKFVSIGMRKMYMDKEVGFGKKMLSVPEKFKLPYEHTPDGVDSAALVLARKYLPTPETLDQVVAKLQKVCRPETILVRDMALVSVAGEGMKNHYDVHARTFTALAQAKIAIRMIDEGADDLSCFIGVDNDRAADAVRLIYQAFYP